VRAQAWHGPHQQHENQHKHAGFQQLSLRPGLGTLPPQDASGRPGRGAMQLARRKLRLLQYQSQLRDAVELEADELAGLRANARGQYQQVGAGRGCGP
jgi:hypothetical protein